MFFVGSMVFARQRSSETSTRGRRVTSDFNDEFITDRDNRLSTLFNTTRKLPFFTTPTHIYSLIFYKICFTFHIFFFLNKRCKYKYVRNLYRQRTYNQSALHIHFVCFTLSSEQSSERKLLNSIWTNNRKHCTLWPTIVT